MAKSLRTFTLFAAPLLVLSLACSLISGPGIDANQVVRYRRTPDRAVSGRLLRYL
jgi:hypothetical protein